MTINDIIKRSRDSGGHFFDRDTLRFFGSRILDDVAEGPGGVFFVTSEKLGPYSRARGYTVRQAFPDGRIKNATEFNKLRKVWSAKGAAWRYASGGYPVGSNPRARRYRRNGIGEDLRNYHSQKIHKSPCRLCGGRRVELHERDSAKYVKCRDCGAQHQLRKRSTKKNPHRRRYTRRRK